MMSPTYCQTMARYNSWMNDRLYGICAEIQDAERKQDRQLFFGSIHGTLNHLLYVDIAWLSSFLNDQDSMPPIGVDLYEDFGKLRGARQKWDSKMIDWASSLDESWLAQQFGAEGSTWTKPNWLLVAHVFNHGTHHRGQLTAVLSQLGHDYGSTDLSFMPEEYRSGV